MSCSNCHSGRQSISKANIKMNYYTCSAYNPNSLFFLHYEMYYLSTESMIYVDHKFHKVYNYLFVNFSPNNTYRSTKNLCRCNFIREFYFYDFCLSNMKRINIHRLYTFYPLITIALEFNTVFRSKANRN